METASRLDLNVRAKAEGYETQGNRCSDSLDVRVHRLGSGWGRLKPCSFEIPCVARSELWQRRAVAEF